MPRYSESGTPRNYRVQHESPFVPPYVSRYSYILLPTGLYYGDVPRNAGHGDTLMFLNGDVAEIYDVCVLDYESKVCEVLCRMRYGFELEQVYRAWLARAQMLGFTSVPKTHCLLVYHSARIREE